MKIICLQLCATAVVYMQSGQTAWLGVVLRSTPLFVSFAELLQLHPFAVRSLLARIL